MPASIHDPASPAKGRQATSTPVFRFAPSPNGLLHLGHAYSALLNLDLAEQMGGRFLLRIEDIDPTRTSAALERAIYRDLDWLGLDWEQPVRRQSTHLAEYGLRLAELRDRRLVYPCFCSRGEVRAAVVAKGSGQPADPDGAPLYPGTCRHLSSRDVASRIEAGQPHVWRLDMAAARLAGPTDLHWKEWSEGGSEPVPATPEDWGDAVLARRDVATSYHLSVVHDDAEQGVTHVVRGLDLRAATSLHRLLQDLFGLPSPVYRHHRLILDADGRKLAKSMGSQSLDDLRGLGVTPAGIRQQLGFS